MEALAAGEIDIALTTAPILITRVDAGDAVVMLAGLHVGCYELFGDQPSPHHPRPKGKNCCRRRAWNRLAHIPEQHARLDGAES
jgi:hypothetical protein